MDVGQFRARFPEFGDVQTYPNSLIESWATVAEALVVVSAWGNSWTFGCQLYVAHEISLARQNQLTAAVGGVPGQSGGIASSKTVGQVSVNYDPATSSEKDAGWWNMTNYGKQFIRLARIFGAGCVQL